MNLNIDKGYFDMAKIGFQSHQRGRNWVATVEFDPASPGALRRDFWKRGSCTYVKVPDALAAGQVLEVGHDYYTCGGTRQPHRDYLRVVAISPDALELERCERPKGK